MKEALSRDGCKILQDDLKTIAISSFQVFQGEGLSLFLTVEEYDLD